MIPLRPVVRLLLLALVYCSILLAIWPLLGGGYARFMRTGGKALYHSFGSGRVVDVRLRPPESEHLDVDVYLGSRKTGMYHKILSLNSLLVGYLPTVLCLALILATPARWPRRLSSLAAGLVLSTAFIAARLGVKIASEFSRMHVGDLALLPLGPLCYKTLDRLSYSIWSDQLIGLLIPVLIWVLVAIRGDDLRRMMRSSGTAGGGPPPGRDPVPPQAAAGA